MKEVTLRGLNKEFAKELFSSQAFWIGFVVYIIGIIIWLILSKMSGGIVMLIAALSMLNADWKGRNKVVKRLRWTK